MSKKKKNILAIVPLTKISLTRNKTFSYISAETISVGSLVTIPFLHRNIEGVVFKKEKKIVLDKNIPLKEVKETLEKHFLTSQQLKLAQFIANYYFVSLGVVLKSFLPKRTKSCRKKQNWEIRIRNKKIILTQKQKKAVKIITQKKDPKKLIPYLLFGPSSSGKTEVYLHSIIKLKKQDSKRQFLILIPEQTLAPQALERYGQYFSSEEIVLLSSNLTQGEYYANWLKIKKGEAKIIIGTRIAVLAPFKKLGLIVIDEEQDMSFKQWDMNPRYDARTVAEKLAQLHQCPLVRGSATPNIESYYRALNKKYQLVELPILNLVEFNKKLQSKKDDAFSQFSSEKTFIVDMKKERWAKNYTCISQKLRSEIEYALKNKQQIILFINRQGMSIFSVCQDCKTVLKCPRCSLALIYDQAGYYKCSHCGYRTSITPQCEKCGGIKFKNIGLGTQKVAKEIHDLFYSAKVTIADNSKTGKRNFVNDIYRDFSLGRADILIGTQMISQGWDLPRLALVGIIDADNLLSFPDFSTEEKAFQFIVQVAGRVNRPEAKFPGVVVLQTFQPENELLKLAITKNYQLFYKKELLERKALQLPPYGKLIKLIFQHPEKEKVEKETQKTYLILSNIDNCKITEPHYSLVPKSRGKFRKQIIVKLTTHKIPISLRKELNKINSQWIIDVDPISI